MIAAAGMDPVAFLRGTDPFETRVMQQVASAALEIQSRLLENAIAAALGGGK